jgi:SAM-dependent methyltransferase
MRSGAERCYLCGGSEIALEADRVRDSDSIQVLVCRACGLVFLSTATHIGPDFYASSLMHSGTVDLDVWRCETADDDDRRFRFSESLLRGRKLLDFGCGNGAFLLKAQSIAETAAGIDLEPVAEADLRRRGIAFGPDLSSIEGSFDIVTMFHVLEHLHDPRETLRAVAKRLAPGGQVIVEVPNADDALLKLYDSHAFRAFTFWSCHLFLFNQSTLRALFDQAGACTREIRHIQRYPLSNHLYWLSHGKPGGHRAWDCLNSPSLSAAYEAQLATLGLTDTLVATITFQNGSPRA